MPSFNASTAQFGSENFTFSIGNEWLLVYQTLFVVCSEKSALYVKLKCVSSKQNKRTKEKKNTQNSHQCSCVWTVWLSSIMLWWCKIFTLFENLNQQLTYLLTISYERGKYFKIKKKKKVMYTLQLWTWSYIDAMLHKRNVLQLYES